MVNSIATGQNALYYTPLADAQSARAPLARTTAIPAAQPEVPVQPVETSPAATPVQSGPLNTPALMLRHENDPAAMAVRGRIQYGVEETKSPQEVMEEAECETCAQRKYQDGSDDPGVSFKTAGHIDPDQAAAVVRGHEQEHVVREQAKAARKDRKVVSQSVALHTDICPDCGRAYVSGGTTRTVTKAIQDPVQRQQEAQQPQNPLGFSAVA